MSWLIAIALALAAFAVIAFAFRLARGTWTVLLAALALGLAGYGIQASPGTAGSPTAPQADRDQDDWPLIEARQDVVSEARRSRSDKMIVADALARRGQYANAAAMLNGALRDNPQDAEAWLALGNVLVEHAGGAMTEPAMLAYRRASEADPTGLGPGYFLGLALLRQGRFGEGRDVWQATLAGTPPDAFGRAAMQERLDRLDELLRQASAMSQTEDAPQHQFPETGQ